MTFPNGFFSWATVYDDTTTVTAEQINGIADDLVAVETTLGTNPQIEASPASGGGDVVFGTVGDRISSVQNGQHLATAQLTNNSLLVSSGQAASTNYGVWNTYAANYDPYGCYNGNDITVPVTGWWSVEAGQLWNWWSTGYNMMSLWVNNVMKRQDIWHWDFVGNTRYGAWQAPTGALGPGPIQRPGTTSVTWQGPISAGQRIRVLSENGTSDAQHQTYNMDLTVSLLRTT